MSYKPLPNTVTIKRSKVDGLGLFASKPIPKGTILGVTHIKNSSFEHGLIRTPLGGFVNHSEQPNAKLHYVGNRRYLIPLSTDAS